MAMSSAVRPDIERERKCMFGSKSESNVKLEDTEADTKKGEGYRQEADVQG